MKLLYVYIRQYKAVEETGISLTSEYDISYDKDANMLSVGRSKTQQKGFWGEKISSLSILVGENGSGKSTAIRYILNHVVDGAAPHQIENGILVVENDNQIICCADKDIKIESDVFIRKAIGEKTPSISSFFYSAHFVLPFVGDDIYGRQWNKMYNATDGFRIIKDLEDFSNVPALHLNNKVRDHLFAFYAQNNYRISSLLLNEFQRMNENGLNPPRYIKIIQNESGSISIGKKSLDEKGGVLGLPPVTCPETSSDKVKALVPFMYHTLVNLATNEAKINEDIISVLYEWCNTLKSTPISDERELISKFTETLFSHGLSELFVEQINYTFSALAGLCEVSAKHEFYVDVSNGNSKINEILYSTSVNIIFLTARLYDLQYTHDLYGTTTLSSGEQEMLDLYSRLYDAIILRPQRLGNIEKIQLITLDEAEVGYHPEWQRRFVSNLVNFLNSVDVDDSFFQVILTTHSPLMLSDIPSACVNYLLSDDKRPNIDTFGANIFELYHNAFFLHDGMVGKYAEEKIQWVCDLIQQHKDGKEASRDDIAKAWEIVSLIADERIRDVLSDELSVIDKEGTIAYYQDKINRLVARKDE